MFKINLEHNIIYLSRIILTDFFDLEKFIYFIEIL